MWQPQVCFFVLFCFDLILFLLLLMGFCFVLRQSLCVFSFDDFSEKETASRPSLSCIPGAHHPPLYFLLDERQTFLVESDSAGRLKGSPGMEEAQRSSIPTLSQNNHSARMQSGGREKLPKT